MARTSKGQWDRLITLRIITGDGDPQFWDWDVLLDVNTVEDSVQVVNVEDA